MCLQKLYLSFGISRAPKGAKITEEFTSVLFQYFLVLWISVWKTTQTSRIPATLQLRLFIQSFSVCTEGINNGNAYPAPCGISLACTPRASRPDPALDVEASICPASRMCAGPTLARPGTAMGGGYDGDDVSASSSLGPGRSWADFCCLVVTNWWLRLFFDACDATDAAINASAASSSTDSEFKKK